MQAVPSHSRPVPYVPTALVTSTDLWRSDETHDTPVWHCVVCLGSRALPAVFSSGCRRFGHGHRQVLGDSWTRSRSRAAIHQGSRVHAKGGARFVVQDVPFRHGPLAIRVRGGLCITGGAGRAQEDYKSRQSEGIGANAGGTACASAGDSTIEVGGSLGLRRCSTTRRTADGNSRQRDRPIGRPSKLAAAEIHFGSSTLSTTWITPLD